MFERRLFYKSLFFFQMKLFLVMKSLHEMKPFLQINQCGMNCFTSFKMKINQIIIWLIFTHFFMGEPVHAPVAVNTASTLVQRRGRSVSGSDGGRHVVSDKSLSLLLYQMLYLTESCLGKFVCYLRKGCSNYNVIGTN